jgi:hypothetical protein
LTFYLSFILEYSNILDYAIERQSIRDDMPSGGIISHDDTFVTPTDKHHKLRVSEPPCCSGDISIDDIVAMNEMISVPAESYHNIVLPDDIPDPTTLV